MADQEIVPIPEANNLRQMLEEVPLHSPRLIRVLFLYNDRADVIAPGSIDVHCDHEKCGGFRRHVKIERVGYASFDTDSFYFCIGYCCSNCLVSSKVFIFKMIRDEANGLAGECTKIYQEPPFGQPIPKRLFDIIGESNRDHFLQARRAIARGLGIGAYAYYRRIVENTKFDLISSVLKIAEATTATPDQIQLLKRAQVETQFSKAFEILRDVSAIPAVLLIDGHNPLTLLHDLLSEGIHNLEDSECLERAKEAEIVLCEIADRMQIALTERKAVKAAVTSILNRKAAAVKGTAEATT